MCCCLNNNHEMKRFWIAVVDDFWNCCFILSHTIEINNSWHEDFFSKRQNSNFAQIKTNKTNQTIKFSLLFHGQDSRRRKNTFEINKKHKLCLWLLSCVRHHLSRLPLYSECDKKTFTEFVMINGITAHINVSLVPTSAEKFSLHKFA